MFSMEQRSRRAKTPSRRLTEALNDGDPHNPFLRANTSTIRSSGLFIRSTSNHHGERAQSEALPVTPTPRIAGGGVVAASNPVLKRLKLNPPTAPTDYTANANKTTGILSILDDSSDLSDAPPSGQPKPTRKGPRSSSKRRRSVSTSSKEDTPPPAYDAYACEYDLSIEVCIGKTIQYRKTVEGGLFDEGSFINDAIKTLKAKHNREVRELIPEGFGIHLVLKQKTKKLLEETCQGWREYDRFKRS